MIALLAIPPAGYAAEKIRISVSGGYNMIFLPAGVAQRKGFFKDEGLDADIVVMRENRVRGKSGQRTFF